MSDKSPPDGSIVHLDAADIPPATDADLARLRAAMEAPVDTDDAPPLPDDAPRLGRNAEGEILPPDDACE